MIKIIALMLVIVASIAGRVSWDDIVSWDDANTSPFVQGG